MKLATCSVKRKPLVELTCTAYTYNGKNFSRETSFVWKFFQYVFKCVKYESVLTLI